MLLFLASSVFVTRFRASHHKAPILRRLAQGLLHPPHLGSPQAFMCVFDSAALRISAGV